MSDLTVAVLEAWIAHYKDSKEVKEQVAALQKLHEDVFVRECVDHIDFTDEIPDEFTKEKYIATFSKIWSLVRHDMWKQINEEKKKQRVNRLDEASFKKIYEEVHSRFEKIRKDVYELMLDTELDSYEQAREIMQKAYVTYSTVTHIKDKSG